MIKHTLRVLVFIVIDLAGDVVLGVDVKVSVVSNPIEGRLIQLDAFVMIQLFCFREASLGQEAANEMKLGPLWAIPDQVP
jgi:hypothetical protein